MSWVIVLTLVGQSVIVYQHPSHGSQSSGFLTPVSSVCGEGGWGWGLILILNVISYNGKAQVILQNWALWPPGHWANFLLSFLSVFPFSSLHWDQGLCGVRSITLISKIALLSRGLPSSMSFFLTHFWGQPWHCPSQRPLKASGKYQTVLLNYGSGYCLLTSMPSLVSL
jgi:hypothetical protein